MNIHELSPALRDEIRSLARREVSRMTTELEDWEKAGQNKGRAWDEMNRWLEAAKQLEKESK